MTLRRTPRAWSSWQALAVFTALVSSAVAVGWDCGEIMDSGVHWNLKDLAGPHLVHGEIEETPMIANWTFSLDICNPLPVDKGEDGKSQCPQGTQVCGIKREHAPDQVDDTVRHWVAFAGKWDLSHGKSLEAKPTRLKDSGSHADSDREGVRIEMWGGNDPFEKSGTPQKAIVELICNDEMSGWEPGKDPHSTSERLEGRDAGEEDRNTATDALKFLSYKAEDVRGEAYKVLRLEWQTKYACEKASSTPSGDGSSHWGFFTWFILILFFGIAGYLVFGSWLNYTRYGARGFDLLPHADTIRDFPYIIKDMFRRVQSGNSRTGYSAV